MSGNNKVDVEIFGEHYRLRGEASPEHMVRLARYVDQTMHKVLKRNPRLSLHKTAVLAALNIADELIRFMDNIDKNKSVDQKQESDEEQKLKTPKRKKDNQ